MKVIRMIQQLQNELPKPKDKTIGFVPTMGYLHEGHLSLAKTAREENDLVVMSIFVNPLQFGPNEDFARYPRDEARDQQLASEVGVDILFMPTVKEIYPEEMSFQLSVIKGADVLCGRNRPGHFDGVATVLTKLFHIVQPTRAYFGLKDAQQFAIVRALVKQFNFPLELVGLPTVREADGLAKSSRNVYLSSEERKEAQALYKALQIGQQLVQKGTKDVQTIINELTTYLETNTTGQIEYVDILSYPQLEAITTIDKQVIIALAVKYAHARLIDNMIISKEGKLIETIR